jgi:hypothetical protein
VELKKKGCGDVMRIMYGFVLLTVIFLACFGFQSYVIVHLQSQLDNVQYLVAQNFKPKIVVLSYMWAVSSNGPSENMVSANCTLLNLSPTGAFNVQVDISVSVLNTTITWVHNVTASNQTFDAWHTENVNNIVVIYDSRLGAPSNVWLTPIWYGKYE